MRVLGARPLILEEVPIRVSEKAGLALHVDTDEANAAGLGKAGKCRIISQCSAGLPACSQRASAGDAASDDAPNREEACSTLPGKLIAEYDIKQLCASGARTLRVGQGQIVTPLARDTAAACGIRLI